MELSSPFHENDAQIEYKVDHEGTREPKELQEKKAQTPNQNLKLSTQLDHFSRTLQQKPKLTRLQKIKRHSIPKGGKVSKGIFMSSQNAINEFKLSLQTWPWSKFKFKLC